MKLIVFSHGKESSPFSTKIQRLLPIAKESGNLAIAIDYRACKDVTARVELLEQRIREVRKSQNQEINQLILVGSSMGGYVSMAYANIHVVDGLFLMCPALYLPAYPIQQFSRHEFPISIIHGWEDQVVPVKNSIQYAEKAKANLHLLNDNHRLANSLDFIVPAFRRYLEQFT